MDFNYLYFRRGVEKLRADSAACPPSRAAHADARRPLRRHDRRRPRGPRRRAGDARRRTARLSPDRPLRQIDLREPRIDRNIAVKSRRGFAISAEIDYNEVCYQSQIDGSGRFAAPFFLLYRLS
jgi:hypothetical protein